MMTRQGRPTSVLAAVADPAAGLADETARVAGNALRPAPGGAAPHPTFTGNRALAQIEPLLFEIGRLDCTGVDLDEPDPFETRLGGLERRAPIGLPGLSE